MERKALVLFVAALLLLQFAGSSQASETSLQSIDNQPEADATGAESKSELSEGSPSAPEPQEGGVKLAEAPTEEDPEKSGRLIAHYTTKTKAVFLTTTKNALSTCFSATDDACTGKRKKRSMVPRSLFIDKDGATAQLAPSQEAATGEAQAFENNGHEGDRKARKFTIWTTLFSTHTVTTTFYYPGTTVSISGVCSVPGLGSSCFG